MAAAVDATHEDEDELELELDVVVRSVVEVEEVDVVEMVEVVDEVAEDVLLVAIMNVVKPEFEDVSGVELDWMLDVLLGLVLSALLGVVLSKTLEDVEVDVKIEVVKVSEVLNDVAGIIESVDETLEVAEDIIDEIMLLSIDDVELLVIINVLDIRLELVGEISEDELLLELVLESSDAILPVAGLEEDVSTFDEEVVLESGLFEDGVGDVEDCNDVDMNSLSISSELELLLKVELTSETVDELVVDTIVGSSLEDSREFFDGLIDTLSERVEDVLGEGKSVAEPSRLVGSIADSVDIVSISMSRILELAVGALLKVIEELITLVGDTDSLGEGSEMGPLGRSIELVL